jgi:hypothetical protein
MAGNKGDWMTYFRNPQSYVIKKYIYEMLKSRYPAHEPIINRLSNLLVVPEDIEAFGKMIADTYEAGFIRAVEQYQSKLEEMGYKVNITSEKSDSPKIFNQKNQAEPEKE